MWSQILPFLASPALTITGRAVKVTGKASEESSEDCNDVVQTFIVSGKVTELSGAVMSVSATAVIDALKEWR